MNKIKILGLVKERGPLLKSLMEMGTVDIGQKTPSGELPDMVYNPDVHDELNRIDNILSELTRALDILSRFEPEKKPLFSARKVISEEEYMDIMRQRDEITEIASRINRYEDELTVMRAEENRLWGLSSLLVPWIEADIPLNLEETRYTFCVKGSISSNLGIDKIEESLAEKCPESVLIRGRSDPEHHYFAVIAHKSKESDVQDFLRSLSFNKIVVRDIEGTAKSGKERLDNRIAVLRRKLESIKESISQLAEERERLKIVSDGYRMEKARIEAKSRLLTTRSVFILSGWLPAESSEKVSEYLEKNFFCHVEIEEPDKDEEFPVLLRNGPIVESISPVVSMYGVPSSKEIDPSTITFPFFVIMFGLMLGDGGYGIIISLVAGFILFKFKLEDSTRRFIKLVFFCGLSSILAGFLFGSWFGIESLAKTALWIVPVEEPELMMSYSILIGIIHMFTGVFMKGLNLARRGQYLDAVLDTIPVYALFSGFVMSLLPFAPGLTIPDTSPVVRAGYIVFASGAAAVLLTQGRKSKSIFGKIFGGLPGLYDVVGFFSDCLSYTRILALGLASAIIGGIVNTLGTSFGGSIFVKIIPMALILLFGHTLNFALNALGAYVHSCRLQFLEFYGKFLEGGGEAFEPLKADTKYIVVKTAFSRYLDSGAEAGIAQ